MSDRDLLIARATQSLDDRTLGSAPAPPVGFTRGEVSALAVFRGDERLWLAPFARAELRTLGRAVVRAVLLGSPASSAVGAERDGDLLERCYRAVLDFVFSGSCAAHVLVMQLRDAEQHHVDVLWRLALALEGRLTIREAGDCICLELYAPGRRGELAALLAARPREVVRAVTAHASALLSGRGRDKTQTLAILVRKLATSFDAPVTARAPVQFSELSEEEVRRRPRRFGLGLAGGNALGNRQQFVGRVDGRIVFRMACYRSAPVFDLLPPALLSTLPQPLALLTEAYTEPEFRGRSIFAAGLDWSAQWARQQGIGTLVVLILADNTASLRGATRGGFARVGELTLPR